LNKNSLNNITNKKLEDSVQDALDFFNNNNIFMGENNSPYENGQNKPINDYELNNKIKELKLEIERIKEEYASNENNYIQEINEYKIREEEFNKAKEEYNDLVKSLQEKYSNLSEEYEQQKKKIKEENKNKIEQIKKENKKLKEEKKNLIKLCTELKIEINRLENNLSMAKEIIEENDKISNNKIQVQNGGNYLDNINNNIDDMIKEKFVGPEIIKQKARNDAGLLIKEREKNIKTSKEKSKSPKLKKLNGSKPINAVRIKTGNNNLNKGTNYKNQNKSKNNIELIIKKYDLNDELDKNNF
jgi:DNA repair exonuclease SbcCD ATPase subunit